MTIRSGRELRQAYLEFFRTIPGFEHPIVASAPVIPPDDPTLMFTSAGMVQFKKLYDGSVDPLPYARAATCQKCLRAGGKGSDLENVGKTLRHHTLFEMLGNFSFGDYFKREAIRWAWQFVTEHMRLPKERLFPTVFESDDEAEKLWREESDCCYTPVRLDAKQNFWGPAGETGACGPCSEVCIFLGSDEELAHIRAELAKGDAYMPELARRIDEEGDTFLEIWNMVFPQFDQQRDGTRLPLKNRGIDTGAGLERMTTALYFVQGRGIFSPYETDLLQPIVQAASSRLAVPYVMVAQGGSVADAKNRLALNAIADHARALVFCLAEGITPSNVGRGYVVRRIQRRALRFASLLGMDRPFMAELYDAVADTVGDIYPEICKNPDFIRKALRIEDETFLRTRERGQKLLDELVDEARDSGRNAISGEQAFRLWDTYGFPVDLTREIAEDAGVSLDQAGYDKAREEQRTEAKKSWKGATSKVSPEALDAIADSVEGTEFVGHTYHPEPEPARLLALLKDGALNDVAVAGDAVIAILDRTPFYAEGGGQVGDTGIIRTAGGAVIEATDTQKSPGGHHLHIGKVVSGSIATGAEVSAQVDAVRRRRIMRHHSAVHLLQNVLKRIAGEHITQAGSFVGPDYFRFDFSHTEALSAEILRQLQQATNDLILADYPVVTEVLTLEEAKKKGAIAPFGEKYGHIVRVVSMGPSIEFCGGTHLERTSQAGALRILSESSIASGIRRIEGAVGDAAVLAAAADQFDVVGPLQGLLAVKGTETIERVRALNTRVRELEKEVGDLRKQLAVKDLGDVNARAVDLADGARLLALRFDGFDGNELRAVAEEAHKRLGDGAVVVVAGEKDGKVGIVVACGKAAQSRYPAGTVVNAVAQPLGGKGGGKPDLAQAGAKDATKLDEVLAGLAAGLLS